ncbi:hypothetical protein EX895_002995 [Sporisorium graminicola]|uniref:2Fe-2S ferredoxin-type domain-containing protein n=1 Tax=Sporisorium graminicola TaxID=280036 RepID=A0A4U7KTS3_9BASI|nr:hypothetical protein EX895_002979 [Sporisorium graminicola]XP_029739884.1 hypothetical protein EX895_002995 [Sporisorium graminicola]TKY87883.1 hypothetical protein EX895_002979 [Sporisorium graminicola]TKY87899.1 hypothetical protein EX895_002995 [Sporisorium graminicola]
MLRRLQFVRSTANSVVSSKAPFKHARRLSVSASRPNNIAQDKTQSGTLRHRDAVSATTAQPVMVEWVGCSGNTVARLPLHQGETLLDAARRNQIELEGACDGSLACSTCHVVMEQRIYDSLMPPSDQEEDLLGLAHGLELASRLGCQVRLHELDHSIRTNQVKIRLKST